ncbi:uncharacterized protein A4U43_C08F21280 [Asparagus officinalis]|nr:uncharacterized protein A4U43_C08F21280 [Asparagus officinalis]
MATASALLLPSRPPSKRVSLLSPRHHSKPSTLLIRSRPPLIRWLPLHLSALVNPAIHAHSMLDWTRSSSVRAPPPSGLQLTPCPLLTSVALRHLRGLSTGPSSSIRALHEFDRRYFNENGWPSSSIFETPPSEKVDQEKLIDVLQDWKTERYKGIIKSGTVQPRPGVLQLMDDAQVAGIRLAVCSAATKSSVVLCLESLIGIERFHSLDCFLAGDDVKEKKPDPSIYLTAAVKLGVSGKNCLVVEDSVIGLQDFGAAIATYPDLTNVRLKELELLHQNSLIAK